MTPATLKLRGVGGVERAGLWAEVESDRHRLLVEFELVEPQFSDYEGCRYPFDMERPTLPRRSLDDRREPEPLAKPGSNL